MPWGIHPGASRSRSFKISVSQNVSQDSRPCQAFNFATLCELLALASCSACRCSWISCFFASTSAWRKALNNLNTKTAVKICQSAEWQYWLHWLLENLKQWKQHEATWSNMKQQEATWSNMKQHEATWSNMKQLLASFSFCMLMLLPYEFRFSDDHQSWEVNLQGPLFRSKLLPSFLQLLPEIADLHLWKLTLHDHWTDMNRPSLGEQIFRKQSHGKPQSLLRPKLLLHCDPPWNQISSYFHQHIWTLTNIEYTCEAVAKELKWSRMQLLATQRSTNWSGLKPFLERLFGLSCPHQHGSSGYLISTVCMWNPVSWCACHTYSHISVNRVTMTMMTILNAFVVLYRYCSCLYVALIWLIMKVATGFLWQLMSQRSHGSFVRVLIWILLLLDTRGTRTKFCNILWWPVTTCGLTAQ